MELRKSTSVGFDQKTTRHWFDGEQFLHEFLNPNYPHGCLDHCDPECLCDVDLSKVKGKVYDQTPVGIGAITTVDELVLECANLWLNLDVAYGVSFLPEWWDDPECAEKMATLVGLVKDGKGAKTIAKVMGDSRISDKTLSAMRRAVGSPGTDHRKHQVPKARILELYNEGLSVIQISRKITKERGFMLAQRSIYRVLHENDLTPHVSGVYGRPFGYQMNKGITYQEWRDGVRPPDYEGD